MKFITLVLVLTLLQTSLVRAGGLPNRLRSRQNQLKPRDCKPPSDQNDQTNLYQCPDAGGPVDLNDCQVAGQAMFNNRWNSTGYKSCGVMYWSKKADGTPNPIVPSQNYITMEIVKNSLNEFASICCAEVPAVHEHPAIEDLDIDPIGRTSYCSGRVNSEYLEPARLTDDDVATLAKENERDFHGP
ncbi:uncharacterized protein MELLADRAFT_106985 [Melampsora larici-populina 98AG31]|uniref:Secreted protein n=1 Tax=Melampsora larici-populina (strain 98AG31 / pathotype 3-4-7) TaxID=747676 RepID=F4RNA9_MELLP|nr:uncharacterized protein MELLADRAFT_106985 [Melampsora larici-populina 98AG31]EGG05956.1 secreted protein [Melampsora larici-populina 98AG31]